MSLAPCNLARLSPISGRQQPASPANSFAFLKEFYSPTDSALAASNLGAALKAQNRLDEAAYYLRQSLHHWQETENRLYRANATVLLAEVLAKQKEYDAALSYCQTAIETLAAFPNNAFARQRLEKAERLRESITGK